MMHAIKEVSKTEAGEFLIPIPGGFAPAGEEVEQIIADLMKSTHKELLAAEVTVAPFFAWAPLDADGFATRPAIRVHGMQAAAKVRKTSTQQRVAGMADAEITIDGDGWDKLTEGQKIALIDHELEHLELAEIETKSGITKVKRDKAERPVLKLRHHDWELVGFHNVVRRHGSAALEVKAMVRFLTGEDGQMLMEFGGMKALPEKK